ncbi:conserved hypothetical protein [Catenulispora acidiphila DSM 44928]|uniref:Uncharacterized protein n=1 Tax=Catenulispora acidiphila (strain DSM 44928 / JCM 14897 / NBRC 102108 / NRRL B-24433 / ID139908) TaxID=479433 RepID=C7PW58_CATAD|nr:DUF6229 family protein [Catenulispora acidiphila]ACU73306.1 conserved hypothetical protein [Catenulispora acidiphila DSM 44928]
MSENEILDRTDAILSGWLGSTEDSPAGPLFTGGKYAEADIVGAVVILTRGTCSSCTASRGGECC